MPFPIPSIPGMPTLGGDGGAGAPPGGDAAPQLVSAATNTAGNQITLVFSEAVTGVNAALEYSLSSAKVFTAGGSSADGGVTWTAACSQINSGEVITLDYSGTGTEDLTGNKLAFFSGFPVTNNSTT